MSYIYDNILLLTGKIGGHVSSFLSLFDMRGGLQEPPPWKVLKMLIFDVVMTPTMSWNIFGVIWKFWKNSIFWVILESLLQLKRILDHFKSWNYPILCVWWVTKSFELIKVPEVCFLGGGSSSPPPMSNAPKKSLCQIGLICFTQLRSLKILIIYR